MRLTLRTLLAYLDDVLDHDDAKEMGQKIDESEFASGLVHRIRTSTRKLRLGAPAVEDSNIDPNSVAEYLDNTLAAEQMSDFERSCLDSDVQLAETAACHQILTLVLGDPADVPPATRERMYRIGQPTVSLPPKSDVRHRADRHSATGTAVVDNGTAKRRSREVPDYMRSGRRLRLIPIAATLVLGLLLAGAVLMAIGGPDFITDFFTPDEQVAEVEDSSPDALALGETTTSGENAGIEAPETTDSDAGDSGQLSLTENGSQSEPEESELPGLPPLPPQLPEIEEPSEEETSPEEQVEEGTDTSEPVVEADNATGEYIPGVDPSQPAPAIEMARYTSDDQILIRYNGEEDAWYRVSSSSPLMAGDRLLSLPTYRPQLLFNSDVLMTIDGGTSIQFEGLDAHGIPQVTLHYGRVVLVTVGRAGAKVGVGIGDLNGTITFGDADSSCAVEVTRNRPLGNDPETSALHLVRNLYVPTGNVQWLDSISSTLGGDPLLASTGTRLRWIDEQSPVSHTIDEMPGWISTRQLSDIEARGSDTLNRFVTEDRPVSLSLQERAQDRRIEVKSLAASCLAYLGFYDSILDALGDAGQRSSWRGHIGVLHEAMAQGPEPAVAIRHALERKRGDEASNLYRMLWGYSEEDLAGESAADLVAALESESLDVRVLAYENLMQITGSTLLYHPEYIESRRSGPTQRWREKLEAGEIRYRNPPAQITPEDTDDAAESS